MAPMNQNASPDSTPKVKYAPTPSHYTNVILALYLQSSIGNYTMAVQQGWSLSGATAQTLPKTADEWHSRGYAFRKRGNFLAAIEE